MNLAFPRDADKVAGAFNKGLKRAACNIGKGIKNGVVESGYQAIDFQGSMLELQTFGWYRHRDWSKTGDALAKGQIDLRYYYGEGLGNAASLGTYGQGKAIYQFSTGEISTDEFSETMERGKINRSRAFATESEACELIFTYI